MSMKQEILTAHNNYRSQVGISPLRWSNELEADAKRWAAQLTKARKFEHSKETEKKPGKARKLVR